MIETLKSFGVEALPSEADIRDFVYKSEDLEEAVTHCASPSFTLPFLSDTNLIVSKTEGPKVDSILRAEASANIVIDDALANTNVRTFGPV